MLNEEIRTGLFYLGKREGEWFQSSKGRKEDPSFRRYKSRGKTESYHLRWLQEKCYGEPVFCRAEGPGVGPFVDHGL